MEKGLADLSFMRNIGSFAIFSFFMYTYIYLQVVGTNTFQKI